MRLTRLVAAVAAVALLLPALAAPASANAPAPIPMHLRSDQHVRSAASYPYDVVVDSIDCYLSGSTGTVVGDILNLTDMPVRDVLIAVTVRDAAGNVRSTASGSPWFEFVDPGEWSSFRIDLTNATGGTKCGAEVTDYTFTAMPANQYFTASSETTAAINDGTTTRFSGMLANNNTVRASEISLVATVYDPDGNVIGTNMISLPGTLTPGGTTRFAIDVDHVAYSFTPTYRIQAESTSEPRTATTMEADPMEFTYGGSTDVTGKGIPGNPVRVQQWDQPTASWKDLEGDLITADNSGAYSLTLTPDRASTYRTISGSVTSVPVVLFLHAKVTLKASTKKVAVGKKVVLSGVAEPVDSGAKALIQRKVGSSWKTIATAAVSSSGAFKYTWTPKAKGTYVLRAWVDGQTLVFSGDSPSVTVVVK